MVEMQRALSLDVVQIHKLYRSSDKEQNMSLHKSTVHGGAQGERALYYWRVRTEGSVERLDGMVRL